MVLWSKFNLLTALKSISLDKKSIVSFQLCLSTLSAVHWIQRLFSLSFKSVFFCFLESWKNLKKSERRLFLRTVPTPMPYKSRSSSMFAFGKPNTESWKFPETKNSETQKRKRRNFSLNFASTSRAREISLPRPWRLLGQQRNTPSFHTNILPPFSF